MVPLHDIGMKFLVTVREQKAKKLPVAYGCPDGVFSRKTLVLTIFFDWVR